MKVVCKTNISPISDIVFNITPGKIYEVRTTLFPWVYIIDDSAHFKGSGSESDYSAQQPGSPR